MVGDIVSICIAHGCEDDRIYDEDLEQWRAWCSHHLGIYKAEVAEQGGAEVIRVDFTTGKVIE